MASPLIGVAGVNSLLFASNSYARKLISPYPNLSVAQIATAGAMAGAVQSILASPVEMFKIRMQGQYGKEGKKLREVVGGMYREWGWKRGIMRGFWVSALPRCGGVVAESCLADLRRRLHFRLLFCVRFPPTPVSSSGFGTVVSFGTDLVDCTQVSTPATNIRKERFKLISVDRMNRYRSGRLSRREELVESRTGLRVIL